MIHEQVIIGSDNCFEEYTPLRNTGHLRMLMILAGDVETNPGPANQANEEDSLISGLADILGQAPSSMRDILCVWSPGKPPNIIAAEIGGRKYTVAMLQPVLAWLLNKDVSDPIVKSKKKADLAQAIVQAIEEEGVYLQIEVSPLKNKSTQWYHLCPFLHQISSNLLKE